MRTKHRRRSKSLEQPRANMTPMIDVVFLLLIFFLCLEFKTLEAKLGTNLPKKLGDKSTPEMPVDKLDLRIACSNWGAETPDPADARRYDLDGHRVSWFVGPRRITSREDLELALRAAASVRVARRAGELGPRPITLKTGPGVVYGDVTVAIDLALDAGFDEITFAGGEGTRKRSIGRK